jgi:hypothetical protein
VSVEDWMRARAIRESRYGAGLSGRKAHRRYPLTGLVVCAGCGQQMAGSAVEDYRMYACPSTNPPVAERCGRRVGAGTLESYVSGKAVEILEAWDGQDSAVLTVTARRPTDGTAARSPDTAGTAHRAVVVRPADALDGVRTGPGAQYGWNELSAARRAAVLRFLFVAIRIGPKTTSRCVFDYGRVEVVPHHLNGEADSPG